MADAAPVRLAEITGALTLAIDLAFGQHVEQVMRTCLLACRIGERVGLRPAQAGELYWVAQLRFVGCTGHAHEVSRVTGDEIAARADTLTMDQGSSQEVFRWIVTHAGSGVGPVTTVARVARAIAGGRRAAAENFRAGCQVGRMLSARLGLPAGVSAALDFAFERWDGRGFPNGAAGPEIPASMRIVHLAQELEVFGRTGGPELAARMARQRAGIVFDPELAAAAGATSAELFDRLGEPSAWSAMLAAEPAPHRTVPEGQLDGLLEVIADFADLKSPFTAGHSRGVADLAEAAGRDAGLDAAERAALRRAALVHDLGRTCVPNSIWDKPGALTDAEWERIRLHAYHTERVLARTCLAEVGGLASLHHEQPCGAGYHRALAGGQLPMPALVLAAADVVQALGQPRAWRAARAHQEVASLARGMADAGRLDRAAVEAVLRVAEPADAATGPRVARRRPDNPAGLTDREVDVIRLLARGRTNREMARALRISPKTVGHHVERLYAKIGVSTRGAASLWAVQNRLL